MSGAKRTVTDLLDIGSLAERQQALDKDRTKRFPELYARKMARMSASPLAFLRGAAPLYYEMLAARPELADGPPGEGWLIGDLHLENFGAYRPHTAGDPDGDVGDPASPGAARLRRIGDKKPVTFNLNDFDDTIVGPWRYDLLRLTTSLLLGIRSLGPDGTAASALCDRLLDAWAHAAFDGKGPPAPPAPVEVLMEAVRARSRAELLDGRTELSHGKRRFIRGPRYGNLPKDVLEHVEKTFEAYVLSAPEEERPEKGCLEMIDAAQRIAGTGSLGALRIAVLTVGKGGPGGSYIFDMKEQGAPSGAVLLDSGVPEMSPAQRIVTGYRACVEHPPRMMGTTKLGHTSLFGRRLAPQEDKLAFEHLSSKDLPDVASYLGALVGAAHARGATKAPRAKWSKSELDEIRMRAFTLAGLHEAIYLALCSAQAHPKKGH